MDPAADVASVEVDRATADEVVFEVDDAETADLVLDGTGDAVSGLRVHTTTDRAAATKTVRYSSGGGGGGGGGVAQVHVESPLQVADPTGAAFVFSDEIALLVEQQAELELAVAGIPGAGLRLWLDCGYTSRITGHGDFMWRWPDRSGNGADFVMEGEPPDTYGGPAPYFNGVVQGPLHTGVPLFDPNPGGLYCPDFDKTNFLHQGPSSVFAVAYTQRSGKPQALFNSRRTGSADQGYSAYLTLVRDDPYLTAAENQAGLTIVTGSFDAPVDVVSTDEVPDSSWQQFTFLADPAANEGSIRFGGSLRTDPNSYVGGVGSGDSTLRMKLARAETDPAGDDGQLHGYIAEIVAYDRVLSDDEIDVVEAYLAAKWGL